MAFGIPGSEGGGGGNGPFLGRIQYDARVGFWKTVKRAQGPDGNWADTESEPFRAPTFLMDLGTLEVGYIKLTSPPAFLVVPYGSAIPPQPQEMTTDAQGKQKKAFLPGFRVKVAGQKVFGDMDAYYFSGSAKTVLGPMDELYQLFLSQPEAATGKIPVISVPRTKVIEIVNPKGTSKFHAPVFEIVGWEDRLAVFGERTVSAPSGGSLSVAQKPPSAPAPMPTAVTPPAHVPGHVQPPHTHVAAQAAPAEMPSW